MGNQNQPTNQPKNQPTNLPPTSDQPSQPSWSISYTNGTEKLDVSFQGEAGQVWNAGTQSTMRALIEKMNTPTQPSRAWIDSSYHQPTYPQLQNQPALPPAATPEPLMLSAAQTPQSQPPNENFTQATYQPAPAPITVLPVTVSAAVSPSASPEGAAVVRTRTSKQVLELWSGRILFGAEIALGVFIFYIIFINSSTRERLWNYVSPHSVEQTQPVKPNVQPKT